MLLMFSPNSSWNRTFPFFHEIDDSPTTVANTYIVTNTGENNTTDEQDGDGEGTTEGRGVQRVSERSPEVLFNNVRGVGGGLAQMVATVNQLKNKLTDVLSDWDHEQDEDVSYQRDDGLRKRVHNYYF